MPLIRNQNETKHQKGSLNELLTVNQRVAIRNSEYTRSNKNATPAEISVCALISAV